MKTLKSMFNFFMILTFTGSIIVLFNSCENPAEDELLLEDSVTNEELYPWQDLLQQLDLQSDILFVEEGESIQDVLDVANSGSVIYIEPGIYQEELSSNKSDIKLIGFSLDPDDLTIKNADKSNIEIINLYDESNFDNLQNRTFRRGSSSCLSNMSRENLGGGIAHYTFDIRMGSGEFDIITLHRVVKERHAYRPIRTKGHVFMVHGAIQDFDDIFLTAGAEVINAETSSPYYLASNKIDVWGIDMGWTKVPMETQDFSFMQGWGIEKDVSHALRAMSIARLIRGLTRQGFSRLNLLGFSYGADVAYGAANRETQQHWFWRDVKGIVHVDRALKLNRPEFPNFQGYWCGQATTLNEAIINEQYHDPWGTGFIYLGNLALNAPNDPSPLNNEGDELQLTNLQYLMAGGSQGFFTGTPFDYEHTDPMRWVRLAVSVSPHWPNQVKYDMAACCCDTVDVSYEEHFGEITVPILFIGSELGGGLLGVYTSGYTASTDIEEHIVTGYSHADLWLAYNAAQDVWSPLRDWLKNHK